jgi:hypothetical protein
MKVLPTRCFKKPAFLLGSYLADGEQSPQSDDAVSAIL